LQNLFGVEGIHLAADRDLAVAGLHTNAAKRRNVVSIEQGDNASHDLGILRGGWFFDDVDHAGSPRERRGSVEIAERNVRRSGRSRQWRGFAELRASGIAVRNPAGLNSRNNTSSGRRRAGVLAPDSDRN
jgi:hypothetical protein